VSEAGKTLKEIEDEIKTPTIKTVKTSINVTEERVLHYIQKRTVQF
jgi:hypothetical protein